MALPNGGRKKGFNELNKRNPHVTAEGCVIGFGVSFIWDTRKVCRPGTRESESRNFQTYLSEKRIEVFYGLMNCLVEALPKNQNRKEV